ncbi:hypothetical protein PR003_g1249 [Phytophthora rubi]|uniref:Uncharacterized protein n=1 Tax=Phytophthora rubi TaxID=129364 RepID=A0A6A4G7H0_9STRA|nr:hypothetical protein PR002_g1943 [Phytophthora rubi]KAE9358493.1 hypothetical protein PR003_g1249 [Phytophthora rubi]
MTRTLGATPKIRVAVVVFLTTLSIWALWEDPEVLVQSRNPYSQHAARLSPDEVAERVAAVPLYQRQTLRALEAASGIPKSTLQRHCKSKVIRRYICRVKPTLSDAHKL